jgi:hypothetical protein
MGLILIGSLVEKVKQVSCRKGCVDAKRHGNAGMEERK